MVAVLALIAAIRSAASPRLRPAFHWFQLAKKTSCRRVAGYSRQCSAFQAIKRSAWSKLIFSISSYGVFSRILLRRARCRWVAGLEFIDGRLPPWDLDGPAD